MNKRYWLMWLMAAAVGGFVYLGWAPITTAVLNVAGYLDAPAVMALGGVIWTIGFAFLVAGRQGGGR